MKPPKLVIAVNEIPHAGYSQAGEFPESWVKSSLLDAYSVQSPLGCEVDARLIGPNVLVEIKLTVTLGFECSRTLKPGQKQLEVSVSELFQPGEAQELNLGAGVDSEELEGDQPYMFSDNRIDLEPLVREQLVLAQEPYPTVTEASEDHTEAAWSSGAQDIDPRWAELTKLNLN